MTVVLYFLAFGLINWFATLLFVESEFFRPIREWIINYAAYWENLTEVWRSTAGRVPKPTVRRFTVWYWRLSEAVWTKLAYVCECHMCLGTWVALALVPWAPIVFGAGVIPYLLTAMLIKAIGHLILVAHKLGEKATDFLKVRASLPPDTGGNVTSLIGRRRRG